MAGWALDLGTTNSGIAPRTARPERVRATRQAIAEIQSRLPGASPGQLSLSAAETGQLSLPPEEPET